MALTRADALTAIANSGGKIQVLDLLATLYEESKPIDPSEITPQILNAIKNRLNLLRTFCRNENLIIEDYGESIGLTDDRRINKWLACWIYDPDA
jgi:hypothetical protein